MPHHGRKVAIVGVGYSKVGRNTGLTVLQNAFRASMDAINDAGLKPSEIDGIAQYGFSFESVTCWEVADVLGIKELAWYNDINGWGPAGITGMIDACAAVASGSSDVCLAYRSVSLTGGHSAGRKPPTHIPNDNQFTVPYGFISATQWVAMYMRRHMAIYGTKEEHFGASAVAQREYASLNPRALMRQKITMQDYLAARYITEPMRLLDCDLPVDGAGAVIVTTAERAKHLKQRPVYVDAWSFGAGHPYDWFQWPDLTTNGSIVAAKHLWKRSQFKPSDVDTAQLYDGFTMLTINWLEALGLCPMGEGGPFIADGNTKLGGKLPTNTNGGMLNIGRVHGISHVIEAVEQLRGACGPRQTPSARVAVATNGGGPMAGAAVLYRE